MRISASVSTVPHTSLNTTVALLDQSDVDSYHLDSIEDPGIFQFAESLRKITEKPFDLHLITAQPEKYWDLIRRSDIELVHFQLENLQRPLFIPDDLKARVGLALQPHTPAEHFSVYRSEAASVLLMLTTPGKSGGAFHPRYFEHIIRFRELYPEKKITVDGGVNHEVASVLRLMGIHTSVSGSFILKHANISEALHQLRFYDDIPWNLNEVMAHGTDWLCSDNASFGVLPDSYYLDMDGSITDITSSSAWQNQLEHIAVFKDALGRGLFAPMHLPLKNLKQATTQLHNAPNYVFAVDEHRAIRGTFFLQN
ncbi:MAG: hypothetical protein ACK5CY_00050 [Bacteroidia bacterium]|jgi:pentose-5-phosphate-3-epimerase